MLTLNAISVVSILYFLPAVDSVQGCISEILLSNPKLMPKNLMISHYDQMVI